MLFSFWLQFFAYWFISVIQISFGVFAPNVPMPGKAYNVLTLSGQLVYLYRIRNCLWHKLNDDEEPAIGVKSSDEKKLASQKPFAVRWPIKTTWKHRTFNTNGRLKMQSKCLQQQRITRNRNKKVQNRNTK